MSVKGKRITVIGLGKSGLSAAKLLFDKGAEVTVTDVRGKENLEDAIDKLGSGKVKLKLGNDGRRATEDAEMIVISPGVPQDALAVMSAKKAGIRIISEIELFALYCSSPVVAVTGTNGKTTTVTLIADLLNRLGKKIEAAGNIGLPLTEILWALSVETIVVAEVSSFQLEHIETFRPYISVILNITPDHLDRYGSFKDYAAAKARLLRNQKSSDWTVLNIDDNEVSTLAEDSSASVVGFSRREILDEGIFVDAGEIVARLNGKEERICRVRDISMKGGHNLENCLAAAAVGLIYGGKSETIGDVVSKFSGLEHRLEYVRTVKGVEFFNDSKATNVAACAEALKSFTRPIILVCGGRDKGSDYSVLRKLLEEKAKSVVLLGEARGKMKCAFEGVVPCIEVDSLGDGVRKAFSVASSGDVVLLSPACSSFDMFRNFEERGRVFKAEAGYLGR